ncbi:PREDICTED: uncharacterized protein LOC108779595 [Cyphomyrmex costatus]|uniref:uncharacterized protein LOC108773504 n=1 Tax=Cyphomyrmex costatus TaxID=456900 RepID=UPI0008523072|nr:PREDICTED: uncharacterized protein LOC108773504 [Cyphomyrmex costatus]XP_018402544.1 PREDICTED: uncharacterized protein LOC108779595 [Cyphomyrmex costatus]
MCSLSRQSSCTFRIVKLYLYYLVRLIMCGITIPDVKSVFVAGVPIVPDPVNPGPRVGLAAVIDRLGRQGLLVPGRGRGRGAPFSVMHLRFVQEGRGRGQLDVPDDPNRGNVRIFGRGHDGILDGWTREDIVRVGGRGRAQILAVLRLGDRGRGVSVSDPRPGTSAD